MTSKAAACAGADRVLDQRGGRREHAVRRDRGADDQVDVVGAEAGGLQRHARGGGAQAGGALVVGGDAALADAGAVDDPLVRGLDHALEVGVGQDLGGQVLADADDAGCHEVSRRLIAAAEGHVVTAAMV